MLQSLATFGAGVFTGQGLQTCHASLPQCSLGEEPCFRLLGLSLRSDVGVKTETVQIQDRARLLVRCHGAQIPSLPAPGVLSRQRPQLSIRLGATEKQTEPRLKQKRNLAKFLECPGLPRSSHTLMHPDLCTRHQ